MNNRPVNRWWWTGGGAIVGFGLGGLAFRWDFFRDGISSANWTTLPAATIGAAIPAIAGVMFAQALSRRSVRTLREAELDATANYERKQEREKAAEWEARRAAWDQLYDSCRNFVYHRYKDPFIAKIETAAIAFYQDPTNETSRTRAESLPGGVSARVQEATNIAQFGALWVIELRSHLPQLIECLRAVVETHRVLTMRVPLQCMERLLSVAQDEAGWLKDNVGAIIHTMDTGGRVRNLDIGEHSERVVQDLESIARRQRRAPHDAGEVNTYVSRTWGDRVWEENVLDDFARLLDLIENEGVPE